MLRTTTSEPGDTPLPPPSARLQVDAVSSLSVGVGRRHISNHTGCPVKLMVWCSSKYECGCW